LTKERQDDLPSIKKIFCGSNSEKLCSFVISPDMVMAKLVKLKMNKAPGVDLVGTRMLIELADEISYTVAELFNKSLCSWGVPQEWKLANVMPIFKKGNKSSSANYRPVSLTVNIERFRLIKDTQHGFVKNKSSKWENSVVVQRVRLTEYKGKGKIFWTDCIKGW